MSTLKAKRGRVDSENKENRSVGDGGKDKGPRRGNEAKRVKMEDVVELDDDSVKLNKETKKKNVEDLKDGGKAVPGSSAKTTNPRRSMRLRTGDGGEAQAEKAVEDCSEHKTPLRTMNTRKYQMTKSEETAWAETKAPGCISTAILTCCGQPARLRFNVPNEHCCWPNEDCRIAPEQKYFLYDYGGKRQKYCEEHYDMYKMPKDQKVRFFKVVVNQNRCFEDVKTCSECKEKVHRICILHVDSRPPLCVQCGKGTRIYKPIKGIHTDESKSSVFMMKKLNGFLNGTSVSIRSYTSSSSSKVENIVPKHLQKEFRGPLNYKKRAIYIYQKQDSVDVLFFALYCREFTDTGIYQNENGGGWFVVDYLDSVPFFEGEQKRDLYPRIILAYLDFMKSIGVLNGFLHADPPIQGDDYAFNIHPAKQIYKSDQDLIKWYKKVFALGKKEGVVKTFRTFGEEMSHRQFQSILDVPLFEGALWSKAAKEVDPKRFEVSMNRMYKVHKGDNFFLQLEAPERMEKDDEVLNENPVMVDRLKFLDFCQRKNYEFGDLRHAKYSSVALAHWLEDKD